MAHMHTGRATVALEPGCVNEREPPTFEQAALGISGLKNEFHSVT